VIGIAVEGEVFDFDDAAFRPRGTEGNISRIRRSKCRCSDENADSEECSLQVGVPFGLF
jgi:hypothetical protein